MKVNIQCHSREKQCTGWLKIPVTSAPGGANEEQKAPKNNFDSKSIILVFSPANNTDALIPTFSSIYKHLIHILNEL